MRLRKSTAPSVKRIEALYTATTTTAGAPEITTTTRRGTETTVIIRITGGAAAFVPFPHSRTACAAAEMLF